MSEIWPQLTLIAVLILVNAVFAGTELALVSLREGQLQRLETRGPRGELLARLARDPNRFLATIQIVITLSGFRIGLGRRHALRARGAWLDFMGRPARVDRARDPRDLLPHPGPGRAGAEATGHAERRDLGAAHGPAPHGDRRRLQAPRLAALPQLRPGGEASRRRPLPAGRRGDPRGDPRTDHHPDRVHPTAAGDHLRGPRHLRTITAELSATQVVTIDAGASAEAGLQVLLDSGHSAPVAGAATSTTWSGWSTSETWSARRAPSRPRQRALVLPGRPAPWRPCVMQHASISPS